MNVITIAITISITIGVIGTIASIASLKTKKGKEKYNLNETDFDAIKSETVKGIIFAALTGAVTCVMITLMKLLLSDGGFQIQDICAYFFNILKWIPVPVALLTPILTRCHIRSKEWIHKRQEEERTREEERRREEERQRREKDEYERRNYRWKGRYSGAYSGAENNRNQETNNTPTENPFAGLSYSEASAKYRRLMKENHPDNGGKEESAKIINAQYAEYKRRHSKPDKTKGAYAC